MDSRIREIEQWLDEAKTDLQDGGREAYLRKLYLLDAEIRAVIKENDPVAELKHAPQQRRPRAFRLPLAVAGITALVVFGSAVVLSQNVVRPLLNSSEMASTNPAPLELELASLNRFPQGEELISFEEPDGVGTSLGYSLFDRGSMIASLASEDFSTLGSGQPQASTQNPVMLASASARRGMVGDIGDGPEEYKPGFNPDPNNGVVVNLAMARELHDSTAVQVPVQASIPMDRPTLTSLPQAEDNRAQSETVVDRGNYYYFPESGDRYGVDPKGSASGAGGHSSEVQLNSSRDGKAKDNQVEKKVEKSELKKLLEKKLKEDSKDS